MNLKKIVLLLFFSALVASSIAQSSIRRKGYRGFADVGADALFCRQGSDGYDLLHSFNSKGAFALSTSHGYQFNPYFYLGAGFGYTFFVKDLLFGPFFADFRVDLLNNRITPFIDWRVGVPLCSDEYLLCGLYTHPSVGVSVRIPGRRDLNLYLSLGYIYQAAEDAYLNSVALRFGIIFR